MSSDPEFVSLSQHHLQDGHERRRLAEVAAADYVRVDVEALRVGSGLYAPGDVVKSSNNGGRELRGRRRLFYANASIVMKNSSGEFDGGRCE